MTCSLSMTDQSHRLSWTNEKRKLGDLVEWPKNPRQIDKHQARRLRQSLSEFGQVHAICIDPDNMIIDGHQRKAVWGMADEYGPDYAVDVRVANRKLTDKEQQKLTVYLQKASGDWDFDTLASYFDVDDLLDWGFDEAELDLELWGVPEPPEDPGAQVDKAEELREQWGVETGQLWQLGEHRLICGDCTDADVVAKVMGGELARMIFADPPYGIGKDIENDDLKRDDWVNFYWAFTDAMLYHTIENAYIYVWGYFDTLSDYWQLVLKERNDCNFRNFIVWKKKNVQGLTAGEFRQFPENYEAALLYIFGQPFQNGPWSTSPNAEYYPETFEPIRSYLDCERQKMGWDIPTVKKMVGHSDLSRDHWFGRSQWTMPTRKVYNAMREAARGDAFRKEYDELRKEYDELRGHFDNSHGFTDLWEFDTLTTAGIHPTEKALETAERAVITTSKVGELVLDPFLGSGTTLIACERLNRRCRAVEISPAYVAVTLQRWADMTGEIPVLLDN